MKRSRFSEEQIITVLKEAESEPVKVVCARHNISQATSYQWKNKFGGMEVEEARRLRALEDIRKRKAVCRFTQGSVNFYRPSDLILFSGRY